MGFPARSAINARTVFPELVAAHKWAVTHLLFKGT
jgi:hypothetical protein